MGHHQVESLPVTTSHKRVVAMLGEGAGMAGSPGVGPAALEQVADAMLSATLAGFDRAASDEGLIYAFHLLTQITQAARDEGRFQQRLVELGLTGNELDFAESKVNGGSGIANSIYDLVAKYTFAIDEHLAKTGTRTDLGEIAQRAAAQSLTVLGQEYANTLFGTGPEAVQDALRRLSTQSGFARLTQDFFGRVASGFLIYHLSKELSNHVGRGRRFADVSEHNEFLAAMDSHCQTAASVLREFSGTWYSKHNFQGGITPRKSAGFVRHTLEKV
ncbi:MAG TPA: hypothetical protein DF699_00225, partial [Phycisphaerales bacterium]|nr:hypothetical protein [Phycisphaerales bacterium]